MASAPPPSTPRPDPEPEQPRSAASGFLTCQRGKIVKIRCFDHQVVWYFVISQQITNTGLFIFPTATVKKGNPSPAPAPPTGRTHFLQRSPGHGLTALSVMTCRPHRAGFGFPVTSIPVKAHPVKPRRTLSSSVGPPFRRLRSATMPAPVSSSTGCSNQQEGPGKRDIVWNLGHSLSCTNPRGTGYREALGNEGHQS